MKVGPVDWCWTVYIIGPEDGPYKIGLARNLYRRLAHLQCGNSEKLHVHWSFTLIKQPEARAIEKAAHKALAANRLRGEWFEIDLQGALEAVGQAMDGRVYAARHLATKDLRPYVTHNDIYRIAHKAQESLVNGC